MAAQLLTLKDIHLTFGGTPLLEGAEISVSPRERIALVGRNGSGKSTLLKIAAGLVEPDAGERFVHPSASVRYLPQEADFSGYDTARSYVEAGLGPADDPHRAQQALLDLGLTGDETLAALSGGEARRVALARVLAAEPDIILLDEPTNHLDLSAIEWLEAALLASRSAIVLISHDRRFLQTLSQSTVWLDRGQTRRLDRGFSHFEDWRDKVLEEEALDRHKLERKIVRENEWMYSGGVTARRKRNVRRADELQTLRQDLKEQRRTVGNVRLDVSAGGLSGRLIVEATGISKVYGDNPPVVDGLSLKILRGDRLGIVGPNGAGKTTLIKILTGAMQPDSGTVRLGSNLEIVTLDQRRDDLDPNATVSDALTGGRGDQVVINGKARHVASYMKDFLFLPEQRLSPLRVLSGGERARLMLARALAKPSNVLVLDEPTNDLDLETLDLLQELLSDYAGTILLVSHDRDFLDRIVTSVLAPDGGGRWLEYAGGYSDMLSQRRGRGPERSNEARPSRERGEPPSAPPPKAARNKLSFKEKHALETLPDEIAKLEAEIAALSQTLADPQLYARDRSAFDTATGRLSAAQAHLSEAETRWLELDEKRTQLEGQT